MGATHWLNRMSKRILALGVREKYERKAMYNEAISPLILVLLTNY